MSNTTISQKDDIAMDNEAYKEGEFEALLDAALEAHRSGDSSDISDALRDLLIFFNWFPPNEHEHER